MKTVRPKGVLVCVGVPLIIIFFAAQWQGIFKVANSIAGLIGGIIGNAIY